MIKTFANKFRNASEAFEYWYQCINAYGTEFAGTKALFNIGFEMEHPDQVDIKSSFRNWNKEYASAEFQWYMSGKPYIQKLGEIYGKIPAIWERMANDQGFVNSNYGYQWDRENQLDNVITMLRRDPNTRQAAISIFDGKERNIYSQDTPCTYAIQFTVVDNKLNMCVTMRSNDLWYGFCNDQYCFARLQQLIKEETDYELGSYYHFAHNLHLYTKDQGKWPEKPDNLAQRKSDIYG